jgi:EAL domain-containing protein (putative c-di-GMP-specific phosphodiesterase class I)
MDTAPGHALLFVNLHPRDLLDDHLVSPEDPLACMATRCVLEITERASLDGVDNLRGRLCELRSLGFRIAIDDLGAGYAGLTSFAVLEPDFVKIDMTLVRGVDRDPRRRKLIQALVDVCRDIGGQVIAEGIETAGERDALVEIGCGLLQGYFIAHPGPPFPSIRW